MSVARFKSMLSGGGGGERITSASPKAHPNEFDRRRIEKALEKRTRYKYVRASVYARADGYCVESPNCSRTIDPEGGLIDVAMLTFEGVEGPWRLFNKNHEQGVWHVYGVFHRLHELLDVLISDPHREFWQ